MILLGELRLMDTKKLPGHSGGGGGRVFSYKSGLRRTPPYSCSSDWAYIAQNRGLGAKRAVKCNGGGGG